MDSSKLSFMFVDIFPPDGGIFFPDVGSVGESMNRSHISPWINLCWCIESLFCWYFAHRCLAAMSQVLFIVYRLPRGPRGSSWWPLTCLQNHWIGLACSLWSIADFRSRWLDIKYNFFWGPWLFHGPNAIAGDDDGAVPDVVFLEDVFHYEYGREYSGKLTLVWLLFLSFHWGGAGPCDYVIIMPAPFNDYGWSDPPDFEVAVTECYGHSIPDPLGCVPLSVSI